MSDYDVIYVEKISGFSKKFRRDLIDYYNNNLTEDLKIKIHEDVFIFSKKNKNKSIKGKSAEFHYAMFLMAIFQIWKIETAPNRKVELTKKEKELAHNIRLNMLYKGKRKSSNKKKTEIIKNYMGLIKELRAEGLGWMKISIYISKFKKRKFSHTYLKKVYSEIEREEK